jgi:NAD(P)-dependent dehydrogenase (short-subunit alcohol dehydrogenase family)
MEGEIRLPILEAKVVVITGATDEIGTGLVEGFLDSGYRVVGSAMSIQQSDDPDFLAVEGDISDRHTSDRIVASAIGRFGRLDTLVNNAGVFISRPFIEYAQADLATAIGVNVEGFFHITQIATAHMLLQGGGHIISINAGVAGQPIGGMPEALTSLTKGGLDAVTRSLAAEYALRGVRVNAVSLGCRGAASDRGNEIEQIVNAVLYLEGANLVTGETHHVGARREVGDA